MKLIKAPTILTTANPDKLVSIGLFGSIEQDKAVQWQKDAEAYFKDWPVLVYNPRRDQWDSTWDQTADSKNFKEQVESELVALDNVDLALFYFDPNTKSPVTLLELGLRGRAEPDNTLVCCPEGFWRKGNIDLVAARYGLHKEKTLDDLLVCAGTYLRMYFGVKGPEYKLKEEVLPDLVSVTEVEDPLE